jgi:ubiquinone/menaquinone biosynthesis C-methylase UbiE
MTEYVHGYTDEEQQRLVDQAEHWRDELILAGTELAPGTRLLDVGCGVGAVLAILGGAFTGISLAGVDIEERQIDAARQHLASRGLHADLRHADAGALPFENGSFDHVWMTYFLEHVDDPVVVLREARRVLAPGGALTAIEVDYNTVWAKPTSEGIEAMFAAVAQTMDAGGRSDTGSRLPGWLEEAGFTQVDPGERRLAYSEDELAHQLPYVAAVVEATLHDTVEPAQLGDWLRELRALGSKPGAALGWDVHKSQAVR